MSNCPYKLNIGFCQSIYNIKFNFWILRKIPLTYSFKLASIISAPLSHFIWQFWAHNIKEFSIRKMDASEILKSDILAHLHMRRLRNVSVFQIPQHAKGLTTLMVTRHLVFSPSQKYRSSNWKLAFNFHFTITLKKDFWSHVFFAYI